MVHLILKIQKETLRRYDTMLISVNSRQYEIIEINTLIFNLTTMCQLLFTE